MNTFYFYDLETFGINPRTTRVAQFAGVRCDENFNIIGDADMFYCQPTGDSLPDPQSCLITGITPQYCQKNGISEIAFMQKIKAIFEQPNTCVVGYNNIRFDDEFIRYGFYRNLLEPYAWSYKNGNSRWDLIDVVRFCYALKPNNSLKWAYDEDGLISFKLDKLAPANNIEHSNAHDALADVYATIGIAKIIKQTQEQLFNYAYSLRHKKQVSLQVKLLKPMLHTSGMYKKEHSCIRLTTALCHHPKYSDRVVVYDLAQNIDDLLNLSAQEIKQLIYTKQKDLPKGVNRINIKEMAFNKSPMFIASQKPPQHLDIDVKLCLDNLDKIKENHIKIVPKILEIYQNQDYEDDISDVDQSLYSGGFIKPADRRILDDIVLKSKEYLRDINPEFNDKRLAKLLLHFKARNYPDILNEVEAEDWFDTVQNRLQNAADNYLSIDVYFATLKVLAKNYPEKSKLWQQLESYGLSLA